MGIGLFILGLFKFILIAVLCIFSLIILVAALIVLMPIRYEMQVSYEGKLIMGLEATWILRIFRFVYSNNDEMGRFKLLIFEKRMFAKKDKNDGKQKKRSVAQDKARREDDADEVKRREEKPADEPTKEPNKEPCASTVGDEEASAPAGEPQAMHSEPIDGSTSEDEFKDEFDDNLSDDDFPDEDDGKAGIIDGIKGIVSKIKSFLDYPDKKLIIKATYMLIKRLINAGKPKKVKLRGVMGFDDPYVTGRVIGALAFISGVNGIDMILRGNFNESELNIAAEVKGDIVLWRFIWPFIRYALTKPVWKIVKSVVFGTKKKSFVFR